MTTLIQIGPIGTGKATTAIAANTAVKWDTTAGNIVICSGSDIPIGYTQDSIATGAEGNFYRAMRGIEVLVNATGVSAGDMLKTAASGALTTDSAPSYLTVAQAKTASDANNQITATPV
jgi:Fe-S cluster assembly ATPase SufC